MTGLEKIIDTIEQKSAKRQDKILSDAKKKAAEITDKAVVEAGAILTEKKDSAARYAQEAIRMAESGAQQKAKRIILAARIQAINETLTAASESLHAMPKVDYFKALTVLAAANAMRGPGVMRLSDKDLDRMPNSFETELNKILQAQSSSVTIDKSPALLNDGFVLVYGEIEINCTFDALMEARRDELKEKIAEIIF